MKTKVILKMIAWLSPVVILLVISEVFPQYIEPLSIFIIGSITAILICAIVKAMFELMMDEEKYNAKKDPEDSWSKLYSDLKQGKSRLRNLELLIKNSGIPAHFF